MTTRIAEVDPDEVLDVYLRRGWRGLEKNYGSSNAVIQQLIAICGPDAKAKRAAAQVTGRRAGGNARFLHAQLRGGALRIAVMSGALRVTIGHVPICGRMINAPLAA